MQQFCYTLEDLLPHRPPMILIDSIESIDLGNKTMVSKVTIKEKWSMSVTAIEFMAQTAAALAGYADKINGVKDARPGFLLGTRKMTLNLDKFEVGKDYYTTATNVFGDEVAGSFDCSIRDAKGNVVASAILNAYRPQNMEEFKMQLEKGQL